MSGRTDADDVTQWGHEQDVVWIMYGLCQDSTVSRDGGRIYKVESANGQFLCNMS